MGVFSVLPLLNLGFPMHSIIVGVDVLLGFGCVLLIVRSMRVGNKIKTIALSYQFVFLATFRG